MSQFSILHLFSGVGGGALGFQQAHSAHRGITGSFRTLVGIDVDATSCEDLRELTGARAVEMDLFSRDDYAAFHAHEPPADWREATAQDLLAATMGEHPDVVFTSPPCKGLSALLPSDKSSSAKYQALNRLVVRGFELTLQAYGDNPPSLILLENVPRITTRGAKLIDQVKRLLGAHGYVFHGGYHDCGEIGGLAQHRKRYLLIARHEAKMPQFVYRVPEKRVKAIGEVLERLPMPGDPQGGPMHRLPLLQWKTWVRLALIPAGGDWRDLEAMTLNPRDSRHPAVYSIVPWTEAGPRFGSGAPSVADPRMTCKPRSGTMGVVAWDKPASTVIGAGDIHASAAAVADPRIPADTDRPNPAPVIVALDGTWHRPLTTLELAALQGFPLAMPDGRPLTLCGKSDAKWRERIGNAVPPPAAQAIGEQMLQALMLNQAGKMSLGFTGIWVRERERESQKEVPA